MTKKHVCYTKSSFILVVKCTQQKHLTCTFRFITLKVPDKTDCLAHR